MKDIVALLRDIFELAGSAEEVLSQNLASYNESFSWVSITCLGTQPHTERWGSRVLFKTPNVTLLAPSTTAHRNYISRHTGALFPEICSLRQVFAIANFDTIHYRGVGVAI